MTKLPANPRRALGKGISSLLPGRATAEVTKPLQNAPAVTDGYINVPIDSIDPNPLQPRRVFQPDRLEELAQSIRANGVIQPLVLRQIGGRYQLVAGERRWRASRLAGLESVPAIVPEIPENRLLEITIIENIQREDLNPIETAMAYAELMSQLAMTVETMGRHTGKDRTTITNLLRLLQLPEDLQQLVAERRLSGSHARCLLSLPSVELQRKVAEKTVAQGLSVREVERWTQKLTQTRDPEAADKERIDPNVKAAIQELERALGTKVKILAKSKRGGRIEIEYYSDEDLDRIYSVIVREQM